MTNSYIRLKKNLINSPLISLHCRYKKTTTTMQRASS